MAGKFLRKEKSKSVGSKFDKLDLFNNSVVSYGSLFPPWNKKKVFSQNCV